MSRIRARNTVPELTIRHLLHGRGLRYRTHVGSLPGRPDIVFSKAKVAVFIDGDFWHGWRFSRWRDGLAPYWQSKIERNMQRDVQNVRRLRRSGWLVIRVWEHEVETDPEGCANRIEGAVRRDAVVRVE